MIVPLTLRGMRGIFILSIKSACFASKCIHDAEEVIDTTTKKRGEQHRKKSTYPLKKKINRIQPQTNKTLRRTVIVI